MAGSKKNTGVAAFIPQRWLLLTAAGTATVGLACGIAKPALAEWWKFSKVNRKTTVSKPAPVENGFAGTIRKLTAESRRAAEQGDYAKAEQLAARAAKISEAATQVVGPQGECSPQETARFLAQTRAQRNGVNIALQPTAPPVQQQAQRPRMQPANVAQQQIVATRPSQPVRTPIPPAPSAPPVTRPVAKPQPATVASASDTNGPALFGRPANSASRGNKRPQTSRPATTIPPSPSETSKVDELLAQSRLAAADGRYDQAIALADQAIAASPAASLFGAGTRSVDSNEAVRWRKHLVAQRSGILTIAATPAKPPLSESASVKAPTWEESTIENRQRQIAAAGHSQTASAPARANRATPSDSLWTEELPPAPAPRPKHQHEVNQFRRSEIARQGEWSAATIDPQESDNLRVSTESAPAEPIESNIEQLPVQQETLPEFPIGDSNVPDVPTDSEFESSNSVTTIAADQEVSTKESTLTARTQLRLRGEIQQVAAEYPVGSSPARHRIKEVPARPEKPRFEPATEAKPELQDEILKKADSDDFIAATADESHADFPIHRVMELRERLQTATSLDPGASRLDPLTTSPDSLTSPIKATEWEGDWQSSDSVPEVRKQSADTSSSKRASLKLREPRMVLTDDPSDPVAKESTSVDKSTRAARPEIVGHSVIPRWKSADRSETSSESRSDSSESNSESRPAPVSQAGYEAPNAKLASTETDTAEKANAAPPPPEWYDDGLVRKRAESSEITRKRSFTLIDQVTHTLSITASTAMSLFGAGGFLLLGFGFATLRSAIRKRHEA